MATEPSKPTPSRKEKTPSKLGSILKEKRGAKSLRVVADAVGIQASTLQRIEADDVVDPGFGIVVRLAQYLGIPLQMLAEKVPPVKVGRRTSRRDDDLVRIVLDAEAIVSTARRLMRPEVKAKDPTPRR